MSSPAVSKAASSGGTLPNALALALLLPLILLLAGAFVTPILVLIFESLFAPDLTFEHYAKGLTQPLYLGVLMRTIRTACVVTAMCFLLGYPVALVMSRQKGRRVIYLAACVLIPLWTSVLVRSYAWIVLLQRKGIVNTALMDAGIISEPLKLLYTDAAVMLAMTHVLLPYMILPIYSALSAIPPELDRAARNLGAGPVSSFFRVVFPNSLPGVYAGTIIVFILALGFYVTPALVGGPQNMTIATLIAQQTTELLNWPFAGALAGILLAATLGLVSVFGRFLRIGKGA